MRSRHLITCIVGLIFPCAAAAGPVTPVAFYETSFAGAQEFAGLQPRDMSSTVNSCFGVPLVCETDPTMATQSYLHTDASAFTDGVGGSGLHLRSRDGHVEAEAQTLETGTFTVAGPAVDVHIQGFFPSISLLGIFAPGSEVAYDIEVTIDQDVLFHTHGALNDAGFTWIGHDIGATFDARHHSVFVPPFFLDLTSREVGTFNVSIQKTLTLLSTDWVEAADALIQDPQDVSGLGIVRNGVSATVADVPEPAVMSLTALALTAWAARRRRVQTVRRARLSG